MLYVFMKDISTPWKKTPLVLLSSDEILLNKCTENQSSAVCWEKAAANLQGDPTGTYFMGLTIQKAKGCLEGNEYFNAYYNIWASITFILMLLDSNAPLKWGKLILHSLLSIFKEETDPTGSWKYLAPFRASFPAIFFFWLSLQPETIMCGSM